MGLFLMSGLEKDIWILVSVSSCNQLQYVVWLKDMKKIKPYTNMWLERGMVFLWPFLILWLFFFDTKPKLNKCWLLKD